MAAAFLTDNRMRREMRTEPLHHESLGRAVRLGDQVELALQLEWHPALEIVRQQRAGLARNFYGSLQEVREAAEREFILKKLEEAKGNVSKTAEMLGLERSNLYRKMKALGIASEPRP